ncbi:ComEC/Rec2 family competence protein [Celeribacter arenosi]|uniref:ComEC/Rec2 family competence protein n=1 Tax=Celeribacter arenosi TaxID=792649 RepID=A0ABP7KBQ3_9RHOB
MRPLTTAALILLDGLDAQRGRLFLWLPIMLAMGIGLFFLLPLEPSRATLWIAAACTLAGALLAWRLPGYVAPPLIALLAIGIGFSVAGLRTHLIGEPVLTFRYYGPVEGRVIKIDRSASDALRLTFDQVTLRNMAPERTPKRVRISLHGDQTGFTPEPGMRLALTGHLSPPSGPTEPGGFDFQRMAWFDQLGAVGYTRVPVLRAGPTDEGALLLVHRVRQRLSNHLQAAIGGQEGAFAAAILTGDRAGISEETAESLRAANLSHLLAISGLHMGLLTGAVFFALRVALTLIPGAALHWPIKKYAALGALAAGAFYLALSGANVATERAFIMVAIMLAAVLVDRQAISLHSVALAALTILLLHPEVLTEPGFQMSFAATTALVTVFGVSRRLNFMATWPAWLRMFVTLVMSSAVAGIATAPVAAAHFNRIADYGLVANLFTVPLMGALIMPAALAALVLAPLGLSNLAFLVMKPAIAWILVVAETVSGWGGSVTRLASPAPETLPLIALGSLFVILWRGRWQRLGLIPVMAGFLLWSMQGRPDLLVSGDGGLVGRMGPEGRVLSKPKGSGFAALTWLENDGDLPVQARAAERVAVALHLGDIRVAHVTGRGWQERVDAACGPHDIVIVNQMWEGPMPRDCLLIDENSLRKSGALAFSLAGENVVLDTAYATAGTRLWNTPALRGSRATDARSARAQQGKEAARRILTPTSIRLADRK